ncbi:hypothetical protein C7M84_012120 [Penaeus vannamei]|uniref:Uncharacterized protein n=1 Tax=Penaeus vannamei TaxID=6689 RepID=A0A3R7SPL3_PENVA|nr:hypothetical protein C7M84_012120 [Penaeus vannamei]
MFSHPPRPTPNLFSLSLPLPSSHLSHSSPIFLHSSSLLLPLLSPISPFLHLQPFSLLSSPLSSLFPLSIFFPPLRRAFPSSRHPASSVLQFSPSSTPIFLSSLPIPPSFSLSISPTHPSPLPTFLSHSLLPSPPIFPLFPLPIPPSFSSPFSSHLPPISFQSFQFSPFSFTSPNLFLSPSPLSHFRSFLLAPFSLPPSVLLQLSLSSPNFLILSISPTPLPSPPIFLSSLPIPPSFFPFSLPPPSASSSPATQFPSVSIFSLFLHLQSFSLLSSPTPSFLLSPFFSTPPRLLPTFILFPFPYLQSLFSPLPIFSFLLSPFLPTTLHVLLPTFLFSPTPSFLLSPFSPFPSYSQPFSFFLSHSLLPSSFHFLPHPPSTSSSPATQFPSVSRKPG